MVKKVSRKSIESHRSKDFQQVAANFFDGAKIAHEFEYYQAAGLLIIHSAIALADALTVKLLSEKCSGENHYEVLNLMEEAAPKNEKRNKSLKHFKNLIDHKNLISYTGDIYYKKDVEKLMKHYERFAAWINSIIN